MGANRPPITSQRDVLEALIACKEKISAHELAAKMDVEYAPVSACLRALGNKKLAIVEDDGRHKLYLAAPDADPGKIRMYRGTGTYQRKVAATSPQGRFKVAVEKLVHLMAQIDPAVDAVMTAYAEVDPLIMTPEDREALSHLDAVAEMLKRKKR